MGCVLLLTMLVRDHIHAYFKVGLLVLACVWMVCMLLPTMLVRDSANFNVGTCLRLNGWYAAAHHARAGLLSEEFQGIGDGT